MPLSTGRAKKPWLNSTVLGIGLASLFSDWSHETATAVLPAFLATLSVAPAWLGIIEGVSDGLSSVAKMASGIYTDRLQRRKGIAVGGYVVTALATAGFAFATNAWQVLAARATAWLGRGVRTPVRKALLAASVTADSYGRAFGFERMMDTLGAILGPMSALCLLQLVAHHYRPLFLCTLAPGLVAAGVIALFVRERKRTPVPHVSFGDRLRSLASPYRRFVLAAGLFGAGDFAHTLLILLATQRLTPSLGLAPAATVAVSLYLLHNVFYAGFCLVAGWLADRFRKNWLLAFGYGLAGVMAAAIIFLPASMTSFAIIFALGGIQVAIGETVEDSLCAELVAPAHHGLAFGVLATVNGVGDFLSSIVVGLLWTACGTAVAFGYSGILFGAGALLMVRLPDSANYSTARAND